jgi:uncharacterized protein (TIGR02246 family)
MTTHDEQAAAVEALYRRLIAEWNNTNADEYAACFADDANVIGFDGSQMDGRSAIHIELQRIFTDHKPATYVAIVREVRFLAPEVALLRAVVGMIPRGQTVLRAANNAIQSMVAHNIEGIWQIVLFQNTPAQFHGRPEVAEALMQELSQLV